MPPIGEVDTMGYVGRIVRSEKSGAAASSVDSSAAESIADGAIDTLGCVVRTLGDISFPLDNEANSDAFSELCNRIAGHVENGSPVPSNGILQTPDGTRQWANVRRFVIDRRTEEKEFVVNRIGDYQGYVDDLIDGLRQMGISGLDTEQSVQSDLKSVKNAVDTGRLSSIRAVLQKTMESISETFSQQKRQYEAQISELNQRMSDMRQDLVAVREEMKRDPLTSAYNRRAFDTTIAQSLNMHFITGQPVIVMLIDLDNFKHINDSFGHAAGDQALKSVGDCLARSFNRKSDFAARYGGDEFAVVLTDSASEHCTALINRCIESISEIKIPEAGDQLLVSCSIGYTEIHSSDSVETVVKRADAALYMAKAAGRNCSRYAPPPDTDRLDLEVTKST